MNGSLVSVRVRAAAFEPRNVTDSMPVDSTASGCRAKRAPGSRQG